MIRCLPKGVCSWDFVLDQDGLLAEVSFKLWSEKGVIERRGRVLDIHKNGLFSGEWSLLHEGQEVATADKASAFQRRFEIKKGLDEWQLRPESALGRSFLILRSNEAIGRIAPMHPFTRRATIEMYVPEYDADLMTFCFWLVVLTWRRAASGGG